jgi:chemotaxis signal transduction protein
MEYVRCRTLSLAGRELSPTQNKLLTIALKYGYETPQAFTKAFKKFHGISPFAARKNGTSKYLVRSFPLVTKMKMMEGAKDMNNFGSPMQQLIDELRTESANIYFCFNVGSKRYAIEAKGVWSIMPPQDLHRNESGQYWQFLWGNKCPVIQLDDRKSLTEGRQNVLQCRTKEGKFGLIMDGSPEIKVAKSLTPAKDNEATFISHIGQFDDEEVFIIDTGELWRSQAHQLTDTFDEADVLVEYTRMERESPQKRLEHLAFSAELLARNASIEAANGGNGHQGHMVVAHELHQHAMEIAKIARELREI